MELSSRHHYLPRFYLNGFCNERNKLFIFDKNKNKLKKGEYSTKTHFFEYDRNSFLVNNIKYDTLEKLYKNYDSRIAVIFEKLRKNHTIFEALGKTGFHELKLFLSILYWRLPISDNQVEIYFNNIKFEDLGIKIIIKNDDDKKAEELKLFLLNNNNFRKLCRYYIIPINTFNIIYGKTKIENWYILYGEENPNWKKHLTSDNPIIYQNPVDFFMFNKNIFIPISGDRLLLYIENKKNVKSIKPEDMVYFDLAIFANAKKYVCGSNADCLLEISNLYKLYQKEYGENCVNIINKELFSLF